MLLTEYNESEIMELFKEEGREEGRIKGLEEGENRLASLISKLVSLGMDSEAAKAVDDKTYRHQLYEEYGID